MTRTTTTTSNVRVALPRLFAASLDAPRSRRATDLLVLGAAAVGLGLLAVLATPTGAFERALVALLDRIPRSLDGIWLLLASLPALLAAMLLGASLARRRISLLRDLLIAALLALGGSLVLGRSVHHAWPAISQALKTGAPAAWFAAPRLAVSSAIVLTASPHLSQPLRRLGRWLVITAAVVTALHGTAIPTEVAAALLVALVSTAAVHLAFGSCEGRPSLVDLRAALEGLGLRVSSLGVADRQRAGVFVVTGTAEDGAGLIVKVYGRDAHDTQVLSTLWRTVWYREAGAPVSSGRLQQAEHEAFLTLLAAQAGVLTRSVVTAGASAADDVLLVLRDRAVTLEAEPGSWSPALAESVWATLRRLHDAGIAHGQLDDLHLILDDGRLGLTDFRGATVAPTPGRLRTDEAQALVSCALGIGVEPALAKAIEVLGGDGLAAILPLLQTTTLTPRQRRAARDADLDLDDLRNRGAELAGIEAPELQRLRRVTWGSVLQLGLLVVAFLALAANFSGLDLAHLGTQLSHATLWIVILGFVVAQVPPISEAVALLGASPTPVPLKPLYVLQLGMAYIGLAAPSTAARVAVNIRFFQRHGLGAGTAIAIGALDAFTGIAVQALLVLGLLALTDGSLDVSLTHDAPGNIGLLAIVVGLVAVLAIAVLLSVARWRRVILDRARVLAADALTVARGLGSRRRLGLLLGGTLVTEVLLAIALGVFAASLGYRIDFSELLLISTSVALLATILPVPGGIGVIEGGLTYGLVGAGMPEETAFAAVLMYRLATFYIPPVWGFLALRWLERRRHL